jgi:malate permease and related proteins
MLLKIIEITFPIFAVALVGFFYGRAVRPDLGGANKLVVDIALPVLIFTSLSTKDFQPAQAGWFSLASVALMLISGALAYPLVRTTGSTWRAVLPCVMFTNVGPVGIPLMVLAYGSVGLAPAVILLVLSNILHFTLGAAMMSGRVDWRLAYANPLVWSTLLGLGFAHMKWSLPGWAQTPLTMIGSILVPMMLISLGARLSTSEIKDAKAGLVATGLIVATRLAACLLVLQFVPLQGLDRGALILFACLPPAVFNFLLADRFKQSPNQVASIVIVGHVASVAVLPIGIWLAFR